MFACFRECVAEAFPTIGTFTIIAIVAALIALFTGALATGGTAAGAAVALFAAVEGIAATYVVVGAAAGLTAIISGLIACALRCIF